MPNTRIDSADTTNFSAKIYDETAAAQNITLYPSSYAPTQSGQTSQSEYQNTEFATQLGTYLEVSELGGMIDRKANYVVGKGFKAKKAIKELMKRWKGNGLDSANLIFYNAVKTYTLGGDFFAEIVRNKRNKITNLKPLNPSTVKVKANTKGIITSYEVFPVLTKPQDGSNAAIKVDVKDMFHLAYNRIADQIHGQSVIKKLMPIIEMRRESMQDIRVVFHRYVKPLLISSVDTDDATEIAKYKAKLDKAMAKGENLVVPKGTVDNIERISIPQFSTLDPLPWLQLLQNEFIKAEGVPAIVMAVGAESTEAESKILYLAWQQLVEFNQMFLEEQIYNQLGLEVEFEFPASIAPELIKDEKKDPKLDSNKVDPTKDQK